MCMLRDCSVCECPEDEVPTSWRDEEGSCACERGLAETKQEQHAHGLLYTSLTEL